MLYLCICICVFARLTHRSIIFDTLEQSSFQKYTTYWVFLALPHMLYLCICVFVNLYFCICAFGTWEYNFWYPWTILFSKIYHMLGLSGTSSYAVFVYLCICICVFVYETLGNISWAKIWKSWKWGKSKNCDICVKLVQSKIDHITYCKIWFQNHLVFLIFSVSELFSYEKIILCFLRKFCTKNW